MRHTEVTGSKLGQEHQRVGATTRMNCESISETTKWDQRTYEIVLGDVY